MSFHVSPIPAEKLERIRTAGVDDFGNPFTPTVAGEAGSPLRCCLREARAGERIALIAYRPFDRPGPYAEVGPVFVHAEACPGYQGTGYPGGFRHRQQVLRAYGPDGAIADAVLTEGADAEAAIEKLFANPDVVYLHSRNVLYQCYMFRVDREPA